jgi:hypothetical protein
MDANETAASILEHDPAGDLEGNISDLEIGAGLLVDLLCNGGASTPESEWRELAYLARKLQDDAEVARRNFDAMHAARRKPAA